MGVSNAIYMGANAALANPGARDLWLPVYAGEVLTRFNEIVFVASMVKYRTITSGFESKFPRLSGIGAERHARGTKLMGLDSPSTEVTISLDSRPLVSHFRIDDIDEMLAHYESRSEYAKQAAQALVEAQDSYALRLLINASRTTAPGSVFPGGGSDGNGAPFSSNALPSTPTAAWTADNVGVFLQLLDDISLYWDENRVPFGRRQVIVTPRAWHAIKSFGVPKSAAQLAAGYTPLFHATDGTYGANPNPALMQAQMPDFSVPLIYNGWSIYRSNLLPQTDLSNDDEPKYQGDFTRVRGIAFQEEAIGLLTLFNVTTEIERDVSRQDWLFVTKMMGGGGTVRPEAAAEIAYIA